MRRLPSLKLMSEGPSRLWGSTTTSGNAVAKTANGSNRQKQPNSVGSKNCSTDTLLSNPNSLADLKGVDRRSLMLVIHPSLARRTFLRCRKKFSRLTVGNKFFRSSFLNLVSSTLFSSLKTGGKLNKCHFGCRQV